MTKSIKGIKIRKAEIFNCDIKKFLFDQNNKRKFDLIVTSPPYNVGKSYEKRMSFEDYLDWQEEIITNLCSKLKSNGSICWQVGNYINKGAIIPIDIALHDIFVKNKMKLRNRIIWTYGHGLHARKRFSGRYEVIMWYTKTDNYKFNLDDIRVPSKYPNKKYYKGPKQGQLSSNRKGKNPSDIWDIPNVKSKHVEKTDHPCQFPIALVQRLVLALTNKGELVFDPFMGVASSAIAAVSNERRFIGTEINKEYFTIGKKRINDFYKGNLKIRGIEPPTYSG